MKDSIIQGAIALLVLTLSVVLITALVLLSFGCAEKLSPRPKPSFNYTPIAGVPEAVNDFGRLICQIQVSVVTPGGSKALPGFSDNDKKAFEKSGNMAAIISVVKLDSKFQAAVIAIRTLSPDMQAIVFASYEKPVYPTWAMNGHIGIDGTTEAGYAVELQIATELTKTVKAAL